jgi:hypothetical protein
VHVKASRALLSASDPIARRLRLLSAFALVLFYAAVWFRAAQVSQPSSNNFDASLTLELPRGRYLRLKPRDLHLDHAHFSLACIHFPDSARS